MYYEALRDALAHFQKAAKNAKYLYYLNIIDKYRHKLKLLFSTIDSDLNPSSKAVLSSMNDEVFLRFFSKII